MHDSTKFIQDISPLEPLSQQRKDGDGTRLGFSNKQKHGSETIELQKCATNYEMVDNAELAND